MDWSGWVYFISTIALFGVFVYIISHYYSRDKKVTEATEEPKYRMLDDEDDKGGEK